MAQTVIIDIEAQYRDKTSDGLKKSQEDLRKAQEEIERLRKKLADTETVGEKTKTTLSKVAPTDGVKKSTTELERMRKKLLETESAGKKASESLEKIATTATSIAKKTISIPIKVLDYATKPLRSLLDFATSLKGILAGLVVGQAGQILVSNPLGLADQYSNAYIGFKTQFKSESKAQKMMDDLDNFARTTPYKTSNVIGQTQKMLAMGWDANRLIQDMTTIGDAAAATGKGDEGLERIVLALAQIKSKGKLSTEELNQLAETGINAKAYVAAGLGYGTGDAAQQKLAKALEGGKIGGNAAVEMILAGMKQDYSGMMESIAQETVEGIKSNIEDTFEINIFRKWGQGLQEGAKRGLGAMADMLDANQERLSALGDKLQKIGEDLSTGLAEKAEQAIGKAMDIMESDEFAKATIPGKAKMLWDGIIAEPFNEWWESDGQKFMGDVAEKIGTGLGKFYNGAITTILGINVDGAAEEGVNIGAKFASGFLEGFDAEQVWEAIKKAFLNALKIVPGGEDATASSWVSAALLGYGGTKIAGAVSPLISGVTGAGSAALGSTKAAETAIVLGAGNLAGNASLSAGALSALGIGSVAGGVLGGTGIIAGMADLNAVTDKSTTDKEKSVYGWSGASKIGMVGAGAAAGAAIGSFIPVLGTAVGALLGAGVGGLGALLAGDKAGESISDLLDGTDKIKSAHKAIQETTGALDAASEKAKDVDLLSEKYLDLTKKIESGTLNAQDLASAQTDLQDTISGLISLYPDLISQYDVENGKLEEKLGLIQRMSEAEREQSRREAQQAVLEGDEAKPELEEKIIASQKEQSDAQKEYDNLYEKILAMKEIMANIAAEDTLSKAYGNTSKEYLSVAGKTQEMIKAYNEKYGMNAGGENIGKLSVEDFYDKAVKSSGDQLEKAKTAAQEQEELLKTYYEIYQANMELARNPEGLDEAGGLSAVLAKVEEILAIQEERSTLEEKLSKLDKGSAEYDSTASKIEEAKTRQDELTKAVEPFKDDLLDVLETVEKINDEFTLLGNKRLTFSQLGLGSAAQYTGYKGTGVNSTESSSSGSSSSTKTVNTTPNSSNLRDYISWGIPKPGINGFASGTKYAPPGLAWVGEEGPELMRMRGGEQIYSTADSMRIAAETARSSNRSSSTGGIQVNLGGLNINITGGGDNRDIMDQLQDRLPELGNQLCAIIATQISRSYANMPTNATEGI